MSISKFMDSIQGEPEEGAEFVEASLEEPEPLYLLALKLQIKGLPSEGLKFFPHESNVLHSGLDGQDQLRGHRRWPSITPLRSQASSASSAPQQIYLVHKHSVVRLPSLGTNARSWNLCIQTQYPKASLSSRQLYLTNSTEHSVNQPSKPHHESDYSNNSLLSRGFVLTSEKIPNGFCFVGSAFKHLVQQIRDCCIPVTVLSLF